MSGFDAARVVAAAGRVAVLMGGRAAEREISLKSGGAVLAALLGAGVEAVGVDWDGTLGGLAAVENQDRVFIALHGRGGEDGQVQAALDLAAVPYTGSGVLGCALAMDKLRAKLTWAGCGLPTPKFQLVDEDTSYAGLVDVLGLPLFIKPAREGSSFGVSRVTDEGGIVDAIRQARRYDDIVLAEQGIVGAEYTAGVLDGEALPVIRLETPRGFYDYTAKYEADDTRYLCPAGLEAGAEAAVRELALKAFEALDGRGWGRVDMMRDAAGAFWLIEMNTVPGMTDHSLVPMAAAAHGIDFGELVLRILATSFAREVAA